MKFRFHPEALQEYEDSAPYYFSVSSLVAGRFVRQAIESGLADSRAGRVATVQEVHQQRGLQI